MNPGILQYKNCWKWKHTNFICRAQGSWCVKCNRPTKLNTINTLLGVIKLISKLIPYI